MCGSSATTGSGGPAMAEIAQGLAHRRSAYDIPEGGRKAGCGTKVLGQAWRSASSLGSCLFLFHSEGFA